MRICFQTFVVATFMGLLLLCTGCDQSKHKAPNVSNIDVKLESIRWDKIMFSIDTNHLAQGLEKIYAEHPTFLDFYLDTIMAYGIQHRYNDTVTGIRMGLHEYLTYKDYTHLQDTINKYYNNTTATDEALKKGFQLLKYYFPDTKTPKIYYLNLILSQHPTFIVDQNTACISLDMFLGAQFPFYASVGIPDYMAQHLSKDYIPVSLFSSIYEVSAPLKTDERVLLDIMIQKGKMQYFLHQILPDLSDATLFAFTEQQVKWCKESEALIYNYLITQKLLFEHDIRKIRPYFTDGPFAHGLGTATDPGHPTPGNIGAWCGYKIVSSYMERNPQTTLKELITLQMDPTKFLELSQYKPK